MAGNTAQEAKLSQTQKLTVGSILESNLQGTESRVFKKHPKPHVDSEIRQASVFVNRMLIVEPVLIMRPVKKDEYTTASAAIDRCCFDMINVFR